MEAGRKHHDPIYGLTKSENKRRWDLLINYADEHYIVEQAEAMLNVMQSSGTTEETKAIAAALTEHRRIEDDLLDQLCQLLLVDADAI